MMRKFANLCGTVALMFSLCGCVSRQAMDKGVWVFLIWAYPLDSDCVLSKNGELLARITSNAKVLVQPTRDELTVRCEKPGYEPATAVNRFADFEPGQARDGFDFEFGVILKPLPGTKLPEPDIEI